MKDAFYFSHDYNARNDEKIKKLIRKYGMEGYGIFWSIVEDLYNNANALRTDYEGIAYDLRTDTEKVKDIVNKFDLFEIKNEHFNSRSIERRLDERRKKTELARKSANTRWGKRSNDILNDYDSNANASINGAKYKGKSIRNIINKKDTDENTRRSPELNQSSAFMNSEPGEEESQSSEGEGETVDEIEMRGIPLRLVLPSDNPQEENSGSFQDAGKGFQTQKDPRAREASEDEILLEDECLSELIGVDPELESETEHFTSNVRMVQAQMPDLNPIPHKKGFAIHKESEIEEEEDN